MKVKYPILPVFLVLLLVAFFYVWPGVWRYRYYESRVSSEYASRSFSLRTDKLTGQVQQWVTPGRNYVNGAWIDATKAHWHVPGDCPHCKL